MKDQQSNIYGISRRSFVKRSAMAGGLFMLRGAIPFSLDDSLKTSEISGIVDQQILSEGWKITSVDHELSNGLVLNATLDQWYAVPSMPSMPHEILLQHKKIEEPWKPLGMEKCYWVSRKGWVYSTNFKVPHTDGEQRLVFKELKGGVAIYLNGELLAKHFDQAHPAVVDVTGKL